MKIVVRFVCIVALLFYVLCWFVNSPADILWWVGISLPWLSLVLGIPIGIVVRKSEDIGGMIWGITYVVLTVMYIAVAYAVTGYFFRQFVYMATCVTFISYFTLEHMSKERGCPTK